MIPLPKTGAAVVKRTRYSVRPDHFLASIMSSRSRVNSSPRAARETTRPSADQNRQRNRHDAILLAESGTVFASAVEDARPWQLLLGDKLAGAIRRAVDADTDDLEALFVVF